MIWRGCLVVVLALLTSLAEARAQVAIDVSVNEAIGCALFDDGSVYCWGELRGFLDYELPLEAWKVPGLPPATVVATGRLGACAIDESGALWCWGVDVQRALRDEKFVASRTAFRVEGLPPVSAVAMGYVHLCALARDDGSIWCWGQNPAGELGTGDTRNRAEPTRVRKLPAAVAVSAGVNNTCAIVENGTAYCWGTDMPATDMRLFFKSFAPVKLMDFLFGRFTQVANGRNFICAIRRPESNVHGDGGQITCWGSNIWGQLGSEHPRWPVSPNPGQLGEVDGISEAQDIDATYFNACAVEKGKVICWGVEGYFRRYNPPSGIAYEPPSAVPGLNASTRVGIGLVFACAVDNGRILCWGRRRIEGKWVIPGMAPNKPVPVPGLPE